MPSDLALFLRQLVLRPHEVVALAPSSSELAAAMASSLGPDTGRMAELGAGTGKITRALLARGVAPRDLTLFELNPDFVQHLREAFPGVTVLEAGAQTIGTACPAGLGAVVSGLPLLSMTEGLQRAIVGGAFAVMRPEGRLIQFTYGPRPPLAEAVRRDLGLVATRGPKVWGNLPPARVWHFHRPAQ